MTLKRHSVDIAKCEYFVTLDKLIGLSASRGRKCIAKPNCNVALTQD